MPDTNRQWDLALDQPGSAGPQTLRLGALLASLIVAATLAIILFGDRPLAAYPQFVTFQAGFVLVVDSIVAYMLFGQFAYRRYLSYAILGAAYLFTALIVVPFLFAFPGALRAGTFMIGGAQSAVWLWHAWHVFFPVLIGLALLTHERGAGRKVQRERVAAVIASSVALAAVLALFSTVAATAFHHRLPVLLADGTPPLTPAFYAASGTATVATAVALGLALWVGRRRSMLHVWLAVALTALLGDVVANLMPSGRYTVGWYGARIESMIAAVVLLLLFLGGINRLYRKLGATLGDLLVANRTLAALVGEKNELVAELKRREEKIRQLAYFDPVTELPNRRMLMDRLSHDLAQGARQRHLTAVLFLDLDKFKSINDQFGHEAGDRLLQDVADRLVGCMRSSDTVARLGGDEFIVVLPHITSPDEVTAAAEKIINTLREPLRVADRWIALPLASASRSHRPARRRGPPHCWRARMPRCTSPSEPAATASGWAGSQVARGRCGPGRIRRCRHRGSPLFVDQSRVDGHAGSSTVAHER